MSATQWVTQDFRWHGQRVMRSGTGHFCCADQVMSCVKRRIGSGLLRSEALQGNSKHPYLCQHGRYSTQEQVQEQALLHTHLHITNRQCRGNRLHCRMQSKHIQHQIQAYLPSLQMFYSAPTVKISWSCSSWILHLNHLVLL